MSSKFTRGEVECSAELGCGWVALPWIALLFLLLQVQSELSSAPQACRAGLVSAAVVAGDASERTPCACCCGCLGSGPAGIDSHCCSF
eukprot:1141205-Pelagomonas_calceolata.AAC.2